MASLFGNTIIQTQDERSSLDTRVDKIIKSSYSVDLNAFYRAFVANNVDPLKLGRVQIRIPSIHGTSNTTIYTPTDTLPWASPGIWNCAANDMGQYLVPEIGTVVFVTFEQGDITKPIYFGGISNQIGDTTKFMSNPNSINRGESYKINTSDFPEDLKSVHDKLLFKSAKGNEVVASDLDGSEYMYLVDASGQSIEMENFGPYLKRRGSDLGYSGNPRMKLSTNRGSDMVLTNEFEVMTTRQVQGQLDDIKILNKTDDMCNINGQLDKLLRDNFKDFGNYKYNKEDKVFNLDLKLNDILSLTTTTDKVYNYPVKIFNEFELLPGLFLQISLVEKSDTIRALVAYRNTTPDRIILNKYITIYFAKVGEIKEVLTTLEDAENYSIMGFSEGSFYINIEDTDLYSYTETWGFDYRKEFRFIVDTLKIPEDNSFSLDFNGTSVDFSGYITEIDWGDGYVDYYDSVQDEYTHNYEKVNSYVVKIRTEADDFKMPYAHLNSRGIVSIESPIPICADNDNPVIWGFGGYTQSSVKESTLVHINKYLFRNYTLETDTISLRGTFKDCKSLKEIPYSLLEGFNSITDLRESFSNCNKLKSIPEDLLKDKDLSNCTSLFEMFINCSSLELVPDYLFDTETLHSITTVANMFEGSGLLKVPKVLLKHMEDLTNVNCLFRDCKDLTYIQDDIFKYNKELLSAIETFSGCTSLLNVPRFLFRYNQKITTFQMCFYKCYSIKEIYSDMFANLPELENLYGTFWSSGLERIIRVNERLLSGIKTTKATLNISYIFYDCVYLNINEKDLLIYGVDNILPQNISVGKFFYRLSYSGSGVSTLPELWRISNFTNYAGAFGGAGNSNSTITNYSSIPSGWK